MLGAFLSGLSKIGSMGVKKAVSQGAKEFAKGKAKDFVTGKGRKKNKRGKGGGGGNYNGSGDSGPITLSGSSAIVPTTPIIPGALARPEDVEYKESDRDKSVTLDSIANQLRSIVALTETLEKIVKKQYKGKKKATEKARVAKDKKKKQEREEKQENRILGGVSAVGRKISNQFNLVNFFTQMLLGTLAIFLVKNIDKIVGALKFAQENLSLVLKSIYYFSKVIQSIGPKLLKAVKSGKQAISNFAKPVTKAFKAVGDGIRRLFKGIGEIIPNIIKRSTSFVTGGGKGAKAGAKAIQRYAQRYGRKAAESRFGKTAVKGAVGKGAVGKTLGSAKTAVRRGAKKVSVGATRGVQSIAKKFGMSAKLAKKLRIPVIGPLITAVASLLSGEPIQQALFKASGAALGGILGTLIPIPVVGTLIGELIGEYFGDLAYILFMGGGPEAAGEKLKKDITAALSMGETALRWAGDGFKRFYEGIPKFKLPDLGWGNAAAYGPLNLLLGATTGKKIQDVEIPNPLWMVNPSNITEKLGIFYRAFFTRDAMDGSDTKEVEVESSEESTSSQTTTIQTQTPVMDGAPRTPTTLGDGAVDSGLVTGPRGQIGAGDEYHIDTKFSKDLPIKQRVAMVDQIARGYAAKGRKMEFSNPTVAGEVWNPNASMDEKIKLYNRVTSAHSHSVHSQYDSLDYYNPAMDEDRFGSSVEGAEILLPTVEGGSLEYGSGGGYGAHAIITDESGRVVAKTGHGDSRSALSGTVQIDDIEDQTIGDQLSPSPSISPPRQQPTADIERQASYDQPSGGNTMVMAPSAPPQQSPPQGGSSGGGSVMGPSTGELLNSYYKRQLLGFLYKQG